MVSDAGWLRGKSASLSHREDPGQPRCPRGCFLGGKSLGGRPREDIQGDKFDPSAEGEPGSSDCLKPK